jgi:hypothetical protein
VQVGSTTHSCLARFGSDVAPCHVPLQQAHTTHKHATTAINCQQHCHHLHRHPTVPIPLAMCPTSRSKCPDVPLLRYRCLLQGSEAGVKVHSGVPCQWCTWPAQLVQHHQENTAWTGEMLLLPAVYLLLVSQYFAWNHVSEM